MKPIGIGLMNNDSRIRDVSWDEWIDSGKKCRAYTAGEGFCCHDSENPKISSSDFDGVKSTSCKFHRDAFDLMNQIFGSGNRLHPESSVDVVDVQYVYLIQAVGTTRCKIGISKNPTKRRKVLAKQSPYPLVLLSFYKCENASIAEMDWHEKFKHQRVHGEWFEFTGCQLSDVVKSFEDIQA